jgi:hypothetical protein
VVKKHIKEREREIEMPGKFASSKRNRVSKQASNSKRSSKRRGAAPAAQEKQEQPDEEYESMSVVFSPSSPTVSVDPLALPTAALPVGVDIAMDIQDDDCKTTPAFPVSGARASSPSLSSQPPHEVLGPASSKPPREDESKAPYFEALTAAKPHIQARVKLLKKKIENKMHEFKENYDANFQRFSQAYFKAVQNRVRDHMDRPMTEIEEKSAALQERVSSLPVQLFQQQQQHQQQQ